ncbi:Tuberous sclerosis 2-like protein [Coemansia guatemalensis]|uniref:Tuberous sclerosis 2-like protein n=1 Tax=Coemansia guatemalensis TaxID=2761395 RepID=A0A9W8I6M4_9FUNG|nr:Tuberous sclerosis 2-like protein [Coemansia guatemalensis]
MSKSGGRSGNSGRSTDDSGKGGGGSFTIASLFRNMLRSPFGHEGRGPGSSRRERSPGPAGAANTVPAATQALSQSGSPSLASISEAKRTLLPDDDDPLRIAEPAAPADLRAETQPGSATPVDAGLLAQRCDGLTSKDNAIEDRLAALRVLISKLKDKALDNIGGLWHMLEDLVELGFGSASGEEMQPVLPPAADPEARKSARVLILELLAVLAAGSQSDSSFGSDMHRTRTDMLRVVSMADGWDEVRLAVSCVTWVSNSSRSLTGDPKSWFISAGRWVDLAVQRCYPEDISRDPLDDPSAEDEDALGAALAFLASIIASDYPVLDPVAVLEITFRLCEHATKTRLISSDGVEEVAWIWTEPKHLYGVLYLLKTVITYGALSPDVLHPGTMLLCTTVYISGCTELCNEIAYTLFTSCYMRDTLLSMNHILRSGNTGLNAMYIYSVRSMTPYQAAVHGMVYYITQVMDTGPTGFQFSLRTGNCLPVLGEAAQCMHPEVLRLVFPYLCKVVNDDRVDSMLPDDWAVLISILESTIECRLSSKLEDEPSGYIDEEEERPALGYLYDRALQAIVSVFRRSSTPTPTALVNLLYRLRSLLSDELAQSMLFFVENRGSLRPGSSNWLVSLEELMHLYYFDRARSVILRRQMARVCVRGFTDAFDADVSGIGRMPFILSVLEQLQLEEDDKVIESVLEILHVALRRTKKSQTFHDILDYSMRAAVEPEFHRLIQPGYHHQQSSSNASSSDMTAQQPHGIQALAPALPQPLLGDEIGHGNDEKAYSSWARVTLTSKCLLDALEWRITITDTINDERYAQSTNDTIALASCLLDLLQSEHTFPSVQRSILSVFLRLHSDASLRLYIMHPDCDTVMDQRVSLHENARLRLVVAKDGSDAEGDHKSEGEGACGAAERVLFPIQRYVNVLTYLFQTNADIETYKVLCRGLMVQLSNTYLFSVCSDEVQVFVSYMINYMRVANYDQDTRMRLTSVEKNRISAVTYGLLVSLMHYKNLLTRDQQNLLIATLRDGLIVSSGASATPQICLHGLSVAMLELPGALVHMLSGIFQQLVKIYSAAQLSVHLLEFVSSISREPRLYSGFHQQDYRVLFAVAINYIRFHNNQRRRESSLSAGTSGVRVGEGGTAPSTPVSDKSDSRRLSTGASMGATSVNDAALDQYVLVMAYQVIDVYYLSLSTTLKAGILDHLIVGLLQSNYSRNNLDEVNEVCLDMVLQNYSRSSEEILAMSEVAVKGDFGPVVERSWIQHNSIITIRAQKEGPLAQIMTRSSSGTTSRVVDLPAEVARKCAERAEQPPGSMPTSPLSESPMPAFNSLPRSVSRGRSISRNRRLHSTAAPGAGPTYSDADTLPVDSVACLLRGELLHQGIISRASHLPIRYGPAPCLAQEFINGYQGLQNLDPPEMLPQMEAVARSLRIFDSTPTVDTHKVSVAYVGPGQATEREILLNQQGSPAYWNFLRGLGKIKRLGQMEGFSAGLDTSGQDTDGRYTIGWRDLIANLVFHVGTLMPAQEDRQEQIIRKKAHMGNDYVHIIFNESGRDYDLDTISSQFNFVQIIVTPVDGLVASHEETSSRLHGESPEHSARAVQLYKVRTQINPDIPFIGPAAEPKVLTLTALPAFVRSIAIHAVIFSQVYTTCKSSETGSNAEYVSLWHARLQIIKRIRAHAQKEAAKRAAALGSPQNRAAISGGDLHMEEFGEPISNPMQASTACEALGFLVRDLDSFYNREQI